MKSSISVNCIFKNDPVRLPHPDHEMINQAYQGKRDRSRSAILDEFLKTFPRTGDQFLQGLRDTVRANLTWHCKEILTLTSIYPIDVIEEALSVCVMFRAFHKNQVLGLLAKVPQKNTTSPISPT
jgi:hypothetical protein